MQVIGLCRFSYLGEGGFQVEHATLAERAAFLYDPARLEARFRAFSAVTLPAMRAQTDPDFTLLVVIGDSFPAAARARLEQLLADVPQAVIQTHPPGPHRQVMRDAINSVRQDTGLPCLQFRMDDDDAVALDFVARLRADAARIAPLLAGERHVAIDYRSGYAAHFGPDGIGAVAINEPCWTPALAIAFAPQVDLSILNFAHAKLPRMMPLVSFSDRPMFVRGISDLNDSRQKEGIKPHRFQPLTPDERQMFRKTFGIDQARVKAIMRG